MLNKLLAFTLTLGCLGCAYGAPNLWLPAGANAAGVVFDIQSGPQSPTSAMSDSTKVTVYNSDGGCAAPMFQASTRTGGNLFSINENATVNGHSLYLIVEDMQIDPATVHGIRVEPLFSDSTDVFAQSPCVAATCDGESCQAIGQAPGSGTATNPAPVTLNHPP